MSSPTSIHGGTTSRLTNANKRPLGDWLRDALAAAGGIFAHDSDQALLERTGLSDRPVYAERHESLLLPERHPVADFR